MKRTLFLCTALFASVALGMSVAGHSETSASSVASRLPSGSSPADALDMTCNWTSLVGASNVWYRIRPRDEKQLDIRLVSYPPSLEKMEFLVYVASSEGSGDAVAGPVGRGQAGDARVVQEWLGTAVEGATYYVNLINNSLLPVDYGLCDPYHHMIPFQERQ